VPKGRAPRARRAAGGAAGARGVRARRARALGELPDIAEDLGVITPPYGGCATSSGCPAWSCCSSASTPATPRNAHDVANHRRHRIAYTGTHDNDTLRGLVRVAAAPRGALVDAAGRGRQPRSGGTSSR
jgi:4-alpha-glucanotransferase